MAGDVALGLQSSTLTFFALGLLAYALIELIEAVGLWLLQRWGEYFGARGGKEAARTARLNRRDHGLVPQSGLG